MAAMEEEKTEEQAAETKAPSGRKASIIKWAIVGIILILFIGIEIGISWFFVKELQEPDVIDQEAQAAEEQRIAELKEQTDMGSTLPAPIEVTVNIAGEDGRFLKCGVQLEYDSGNAILGQELELRKARIKDIILDIMSSQSLSDLITNDGKKVIRDKIVTEVNSILPETTANGEKIGKVRRSYFDSFIMQ